MTQLIRRRRRGKEAASSSNDADSAKAVPTIRPGERLSEFNQRVDAALPLSGLVNKTVRNGKDPLGLKVWRTKKERQMHKLYDEWREEDRKIKEKREEELEEAEEQELEDEALGVSWKLEDEAASGKKKKRKGGKYIGEAPGKEEDPWMEIKRKRGEAKIGINDVAQAPPELKAPPKKFTVRGAAVDVDNIPKTAGSLETERRTSGHPRRSAGLVSKDDEQEAPRPGRLELIKDLKVRMFSFVYFGAKMFDR